MQEAKSIDNNNTKICVDWECALRSAYNLHATRSMEIENVRVLQDLICARRHETVSEVLSVRELEITVARTREGPRICETIIPHKIFIIGVATFEELD